MLIPLSIVPIQCGPGTFVLWVIGFLLFYFFLSVGVSETLRIWQLKVRFCRANLTVYVMGITS